MTQIDQQNTPKLRFPGFEGNWERCRLGNLGSFKSGVGFPEAEQGGATGVPFYKVSDMNLPSNKSVMMTANNYVTDDQVARLKLKPIKTRAVIFAKVGAAIFLERKRQAKDFLLDNNMMAFIPGDHIVPEYLSHLFSVLRLSKFAQVGALPSYNGSDLATIKLSLPTLPEQRKIAGFLGAVDTKIAQLAEKKRLLEDYKKGCMQQLFSQKIRFKDDIGNDFPDWEEKRLGEVADCLDNKRKPLNSSEREQMKGDIPYYGANGQVDSISEYIFDEPLVLLAEDGGNFDEYATRPIAQKIEGKSWVNNHAHILRARRGTLVHEYLFQILVHRDIRKYINGSSRAKLNKSDMLSILIEYPHPDEQRKIADFLSALDRKIDLVGQELTHARTFKQGLLQQMFV